MNDHVLNTLEAAGVSGRPTALLERDGAFFALTPDMLVYADAQGPQLAALRDLTRIHTDEGGQLRVKSREGDVIVAPLAGFDVPRTQLFFAEVRSVTARAKALPTAPVPAPSGPWKGNWMQGGAAEHVPVTLPTAGTAVSDSRVVIEKTAEAQQPTVSSVGEPEGAEMAVQEASPGEERWTTDIEPSPVVPVVRSQLGEEAQRLERAGTTLRLLAVLMFLTGIGVGALQWLDGEALGGLWTFGVGAVGAFALVVFAKATRVLSLLALSFAPERP